MEGDGGHRDHDVGTGDGDNGNAERQQVTLVRARKMRMNEFYSAICTGRTSYDGILNAQPAHSILAPEVWSVHYDPFLGNETMSYPSNAMDHQHKAEHNSDLNWQHN
jgi:hypothetical protein